MRTLASAFGFATVGIFVAAFFSFSFLTPNFDLVHDYISRLGAKGQPFARWWNATGFITVGALFALFGCSLGVAIKDYVAGFCLFVAGIGFALGAAPMDFSDTEATLSKVHFASICLSMGGYFFALARLSHVASAEGFLKPSVNKAATFAILPLIGMGIGVVPEPIAHRLILLVVFGWVVYLSRRLAKPILLENS